MEVKELVKPVVVQGNADVKNYTDEANKVSIQIHSLLNDGWNIYGTNTIVVGAVGYIVYVLYKENLCL